MMRAILVPVVLLAAGFGLFAACGDDEATVDVRSEAALAVAQYWRQELNGAVLPEGVNVIERGTQGIVELDPGDGAQDRVCVEYQYTESVSPFGLRTRVYIATRADGAWTFEVVHEDGTCEGVS